MRLCGRTGEEGDPGLQHSFQPLALHNELGTIIDYTYWCPRCGETGYAA